MNTSHVLSCVSFLRISLIWLVATFCDRDSSELFSYDLFSWMKNLTKNFPTICLWIIWFVCDFLLQRVMANFSWLLVSCCESAYCEYISRVHCCYSSLWFLLAALIVNVSRVSSCDRAAFDWSSVNGCLPNEEKIFTSEYILDFKRCWPIIEDFDFVFFLQHLLIELITSMNYFRNLFWS